MTMVLPVNFGWRDKVDAAEWRGVLACEFDCKAENSGTAPYTHHTGYKAKRQGTLYRLPLLPLGRSAAGYVACDRCGKGAWYKGDDFHALGRHAVRIAEQWAAEIQRQTDERKHIETALGVDLRELGLAERGAGYLIKDWRGHETVASLEAVLRHPENFLLNEDQEAYIRQWQQAHPLPRKRAVYCSTCGADIANSDHTPDCDTGVVLS
jgi:hypothetical protein